MNRSLFARYFISFALVVTLSFVLLGSVFLYQINRFSVEENGVLLANTLKKAIAQTESYISISNDTRGIMPERAQKRILSMYTQNMVQCAVDCGGTVFVCDENGSMLFLANEDGGYLQNNSGRLPQSIISSFEKTSHYSGITDMGGYLTHSSFVIGEAENISDAKIIVFAAIPADRMIELFARLSRIFVLLTICVLLLSLVITIFITGVTVKPMHDMSAAAKKFSRGDYSARVKLPKHRDELYNLAMSFNSVAATVENAEEYRRQLVADVAHDLRTPMTTIAGYIDGILDGTIKDDKRDYYLQIVSDEIKRLSRLANSILEFSKLESGEKKLDLQTFDVAETLRRIIINFERKISEKNVEMDIDVPDKLMATADRDAVFQVIYNLVDNAVKFVDENGKISMCLREKNGRIQFNISNSGQDIPPDKLKHIFDRFYKVDSSRGDVRTSSGLGLYIVKTIVNRHGGDIYAKNENNITEFCFSVPVHVNQKQEKDQNERG